MIGRIWHGWTKPADADAYESLLRHEILLGIQDRRIAGFQGIQLLRRSLTTEVEFVTIMWFDSIDAVRAFAGDDYEASSRIVLRICERACLEHVRRKDDRDEPED